MQFSLRDLLLLFVFVAIFSWCAAEMGPESGVFWFVAVFSAIISTLFLRAAYSGLYGFALLAVGAGIGFQIFFLIGVFVSFALLLNFMLLGALAIFFMNRPPMNFRIAVLSVATCAALAFAAGVFVVNESVQRLHDLRAEFPFESFTNRLGYEQNRADLNEAPLTLAVKLNQRLKNDAELYEDEAYRAWMFERLHSTRYESFVRAEGFGIGRMSSPRREYLQAPPLRNVALNERLPKDYESSRWDRRVQREKVSPFTNLHNISRFSFADPEYLGLTRTPRSEIAGFATHGNRVSPTAIMEDKAGITLHQLELVSLLKYPEPRVYVLDHLPRMDQLSAANVPTRSLDEFETASLAKLRTQEDLVIDESQPVVRMLGSLRASNRCLDCHNVQRGELLGAFSYALTTNTRAK